jgi:predicted dehydrogenase
LVIESRNIGGQSRLTYGQIGGGPGSFIGPVHRAAIAMNNQARIVSGCFSQNLEKSKETARELDIDLNRVYSSYEEMAQKEALRKDRMDFVVVSGPNHMHYETAKSFLEKDFHVVCEKPLSLDLTQAKTLLKLSKERKRLFMVTYTYTGYPMVREARHLVRSGKLGEIRLVVAEYAQDWLAEKAEESGNRQAQWRTDPRYAGISCCVGDIGTHIENMVHYITGLEIKRLSARLDTFVKGRSLDDNAFILLTYENGASGSYWASQVAVGKENGLVVRIYGTKGAIEWEQENPNELRLSLLGAPQAILRRGNGYLSAPAKSLTRLPSGHPEGYFEAFSNLYRNFCVALTRFEETGTLEPRGEAEDFTDVLDGARGIGFVEDCVKSSRLEGAWVDATKISEG